MHVASWHFRRILPGTLLMLCLAANFTDHGRVVSAAETIVVHTHDGRVRTGVVDAQTTGTDLWLRASSPGIVAMSSIRWNDISRIEAGGKIYPVEAFVAVSERFKSSLSADFFAKTPADRLEEAERAAEAARLNAVDRRVQSLTIDAYLANWDRDAEVDGLELRVYPLNIDRAVIPVDGLVTAELIGQYYPEIHIFDPVQQEVQLLEKWTERVHPRSFGNDGAVLRLRFRARHPEFDLAVRYFGQVNVKLNVQGQGTYDATVPVTLRTFSPLREQLQLYHGTGFSHASAIRWGGSFVGHVCNVPGKSAKPQATRHAVL